MSSYLVGKQKLGRALREPPYFVEIVPQSWTLERWRRGVVEVVSAAGAVVALKDDRLQITSYAEAAYFDGAHVQHIADWLEHKRLKRLRDDARRALNGRR